MISMEEKFLASKLYSLLYPHKNIYNVQPKTNNFGSIRWEQDPLTKYALIVRELMQYKESI